VVIVRNNNYKISIIVCTYNRADILEYCLDSLANQTVPRESYEIIVINNNSSDATQRLCDQYAGIYSNLRVIFESLQGLSHARNRGWYEAKTDWIAYIDDDAKAPSDYIERLFAVIQDYQFDCFGGVFLPWYKYGKPRWYKDEYATNRSTMKDTGILVSGYASGGVIAMKREVLSRLGGFPVHLGMTGNKIGYDEETVLQRKMRQAGYTIGFDPHLKIHHLVSENKMNISWFMKTAYASGTTSWQSLDMPINGSNIIRFLVSAIYGPFKYLLINAPALFREDYHIQNLCIDVSQPIARSLGALVGAFQHMRKNKRID